MIVSEVEKGFPMEYLTTKEVAEILKVSDRRVRAKIAQGHFLHAKRCGCEKNNWLIPAKDLVNKKGAKSP